MKNPTNRHEPPFRTPPPPVASIEDLCANIQRRAMRSKAATFHIYLHGHTNAIDVVARSRDHNYMAPANEWPEPLMSRYVPLNSPDALEQLQSVLDEMKALEREAS